MIAKQSRAFPASCSVTGSFDQQERKEGEGDRARERKRSRQTHAVPSEMQQHAPYLGARCLRWSLHLTRQSCEREKEQASTGGQSELFSLFSRMRHSSHYSREQGTGIQDKSPLRLPVRARVPSSLSPSVCVGTRDDRGSARDRQRERERDSQRDLT